jgi:hypothetical protein
VDFAPISAAIAVFAWIFAGVFYRFFSVPADGENPPMPRRHMALRFVSRSIVVGLYQNVLFFLLPIWFGSATLLSANIVFPILLGALALFSCFDATFAEHVLSHSFRRSIVSAVVLFAVSVPAVCLITHIPVRFTIAVCAGVSVFAATILGASQRRLHTNLGIGTALAVIFALIFYFGAIFLPPTPVQCIQAVAAAGLAKRAPIDIARTFPRGTPKVFAHFSVAAPDRFVQDINFQWYVKGTERGRPIPSKIIGGRKQGFRTWTYLSTPHSGDYRVDLITRDKQLIGRVSFRVK